MMMMNTHPLLDGTYMRKRFTRPRPLFVSEIRPLLFVAVIFTACGSDEASPGAGASTNTDCASSVISGSWTRTLLGNPDTITFNPNCSGTASRCSATFTYPNVTASSGSVLLTVTSTSGISGCLPVGEHTCTYSVSGNTLNYSCGGSGLTYTR